MNHRASNRWKGLVLGMLGGVAGTAAMGYYWQAVTALTGEDPRTKTSEGGPHELDSISLVGTQHEADESSTAALGRVGYESLVGEEPGSDGTKSTLSTLVHWSHGTLMGGAYGALRGAAGVPDLRGGLVFGAALWLFGDELSVSLLGLAEGPTKFPPEQHVHRLGSHLAYGTTVAVTTQVLQRVFGVRGMEA